MRAVLIFPILALCIFPGTLFAEKLYRYVDEKGQVTFTDKQIGTGIPARVDQVRVEKPKARFNVQNRGSRSEPVLYAINSYFGPVETEFRLKDLSNMTVSRQTPKRAVVPASSELRMLSMQPRNPRASYAYSWEYSCVFGDPKAQHRPTRPYLLPVPLNTAFNISQGFFGQATHNSHLQSLYAIDIPMPVGTAIHAARSGVVMDMAGDFFEGGDSEKMMEQANYVRILHDDGTMAVYAHLELETVKYPIGKRIRRGQVLARSGNTGFSTGPHLHFSIQKNFGMELRSIPFEFEGAGGSAYTPAEGMTVFRTF